MRNYSQTKNAIRLREYYQRPEVKQRRHEYYQKYKQRPEIKQRLREYYQRPEVKQRRHEYYQKYYQRPEVKQRKHEYYQKYKQRIHEQNLIKKDLNTPPMEKIIALREKWDSEKSALSDSDMKYEINNQ